jgi:hypothetical protein
MTRLTVVLLTLAALLVPATSPAGAQSAGSIELVAQSSWTDDGGIFDLQVRVAGAESGSSVVMRVFDPLVDRLQVRTDVADLPPLLETEPVKLDELQESSNEVLSLEIALVGPRTVAPEPLDETEPELPVLLTEGDSAVYPVVVELLDSDGELTDSVRTHLIELPRRLTQPPLQVVIVLPVDLPVTLQPDGTRPLTTDALAPLIAALDLFDLHPEAAITLDITPENLQAIANSPDPAVSSLFARLQDHLSAEQLFTRTFVEVDAQAWVDARLEVELSGLVDAGERVRSEFAVESSSPTIMYPSTTTDPSGVDWMIDYGTDGLILRSEHLDPLDTGVFTRQPNAQFLVTAASGSTLPALAVNASYDTYFGAEEPAAEAANNLLAELTLEAIAEPNQRRAVVLAPRAELAASPAFLNVLLSGIDRLPVLRTATPAAALTLTDFVPASGVGTIGSPLRRGLAPRQSEPLGAYRTEYFQAVQAISSWNSVLIADPTSIDPLNELLFVSASGQLNADQQLLYIEQIYSIIDQQKNSAVISPATDTITLTGRETSLPLVIENNMSVPLSVVLLLDSEKLDFPEGNEVPVVLFPGTNRIELPIEALASGDSPIHVQVFSPDLVVRLASSELLVRTFAFSGIGFVIGGGAILVIVVWWWRHRRDERPVM